MRLCEASHNRKNFLFFGSFRGGQTAATLYSVVLPQQIADVMHMEGFKPAKGTRITAAVVRIWLSRYGLATRQTVSIETAANEWTIPQLVDRYQLPVSTIHGWIRHGKVAARQIADSGGRWILRATPQQLDELVNQRRKRASAADENGSKPIIPADKAVSRGVL